MIERDQMFYPMIDAPTDEGLAKGQELKRLMEAQWRNGPCAKARGLCRWVPPMRLGSTYGYQDDLAHD